VIVMTSNLGSDLIQAMVGEPHAAIRDAVMTVVGQHFRPEFINRVDEAVVFHALSRDHIRGILTVQLGRLEARLAEMDLHLSLSDDALDALAEAGFDPVYGARPLKRAIQTHLENPLASALLRGAFLPGETIHVTRSDEGSLTFEQRDQATVS